MGSTYSNPAVVSDIEDKQNRGFRKLFLINITKMATADDRETTVGRSPYRQN
jgi:hypothetical protein